MHEESEPILLSGNECANIVVTQINLAIVSIIVIAAARQFGLATMGIGIFPFGRRAVVRIFSEYPQAVDE
jgi:hypothetical protein